MFIDDHAGLRDSLTCFLQNKNPSLAFYTAADPEKAVTYLKSYQDISVAIVDLNLNGEDGLAVVDALRTISPGLRIIIYTMYNDPFHIEKALQKNIQGFITKDLGLDEVEKAIISVSEGNLYYSNEAQKIMYRLLNGSSSTSSGGFSNEGVTGNERDENLFKNYKSLTKKEQELFHLLAEKKDIYEAAKELGKSVKTIQNQKTSIYSKMQLKDRLDLVDAAKALGVII